MKHIEDRFLSKVSVLEYNKHVDDVRRELYLFNDELMNKLPALTYETSKELAKRYTKEEIDAMLA